MQTSQTETLDTCNIDITSVNDKIPKKGDFYPNDTIKTYIIDHSDPVSCEIQYDDDKTKTTVSFLTPSMELATMEPVKRRKVKIY